MRAFLAALIVCAYVTAAGARDDGRYADSPLKSWFDQLASGKGLCCSFADGFKVENVDWDTQCERLGGKSANARERAVGEQTQTCRYRVRLHGECRHGTEQRRLDNWDSSGADPIVYRADRELSASGRPLQPSSRV